jgi:predicted P-loop ATPase
LDLWLHTYLGAPVDELGNPGYVEAVGSKWVISAVARVFEPGCKADCVLILEGEQGIKKSSALKALAPAWFTDDIADLGSKDSSMQVHGVWIIEIAELESMSKAEIGAIKAFITRTVDRYRPPYASRLVHQARQCVFAGSVNGSDYLRDDTGGRRFWPIRCGDINVEALARDRDQIWAEAMQRYRNHATWWLDNSAVVVQAETEQLARYRGDAWDAKIHQFIQYEDEVTIHQILADVLGIPVGKWTQTDYNRVAASLRVAGWRKARARDGEERPYVYRPHTLQAKKASEQGRKKKP